MLRTFIILAVAAIAAWLALETVWAFRAAPGVTRDRLAAAFKGSATIAWARINALSSVAVAALIALSEWLGAPGFKETLAPYLSSECMLAYLIVVLVGAELARRRTL